MPWQAERPFGERDGQALAANETPRTIALGDRLVHYVLRRARRRSIGLSIDHRGLRVGAPTRASIAEVESLILRHRDWVRTKLDEWRSRPRQEPLRIVDGCRLPVLGQSLLVHVQPGGNRAVWAEQPEPGDLSANELSITLQLRSPSNAAAVLERALRRKALPLFAERLAIHAAKFGFAPPPLALSSARTRWGSCSLKSGIRLNWRLIHCSLPIIDYVVIHELAHVREMNHSPRFWALVEAHCPDHKTLRQHLKRATFSFT